jgi:3-keto-5-aminohexanoate cleavage enzyme
MADLSWRDPYVLMVAPNGARRTKADHPALPMLQDEIVDAVAEAHAAGAHAAHVHVRDEAGQHVLDADRCLRLSDALRSRCGDDLIIQITSEAVGRYTPADQRELVRAVRPEAVSIAFRELFAASDEDGTNREFVHWAAENRVAIQWILYDPSDVIPWLARWIAASLQTPDRSFSCLAAMHRVKKVCLPTSFRMWQT